MLAALQVDRLAGLDPVELLAQLHRTPSWGAQLAAKGAAARHTRAMSSGLRRRPCHHDS